MKLTTRDHLIEVGSLKVSPEMDIEELVKPVRVMRIPVMDTFSHGIETLSVALEEPYLKMSNSTKNWTIYQKDRYGIAEQSGDEFLVMPWQLDSMESFELLKKHLAEGKLLVQQQATGYRVLARAKDAENLVVEKDHQGLWLEACRSYLEIEMLAQAKWSFSARRISRLDAIIKDVALTYTANNYTVKEAPAAVESVFSATSFFMNTMEDLLDVEVALVAEFVQEDPWAYYSIVIDGQGLAINRHRDARALVWNKNAMDEIQSKENEQEVLSAWALR